MIEIIDTPQPVQKYLPRLGDVHTIIRYITSRSPNSDKHIKVAEVKAIKAAGKKLAIVHEVWGDFRHAGRGGISGADGAYDGKYARNVMPKLGAPAGACVYFAVDTDGSAAQLKNNVLPYFKAIREAFADEQYRVGIYAPGSFCRAVLDAGYADLGWLPNAKGWSGYKDFKPHAALVQLLPTHIAGGLDVDPDVAQVEDWGQFVPFSSDGEGLGILGGLLAGAGAAAVAADGDKDKSKASGKGDGDSTDDADDNDDNDDNDDSDDKDEDKDKDGDDKSKKDSDDNDTVKAVKSLAKSKLAWLSTLLGGGGAATAAGSDNDVKHLALALISKPSFWMALAFIGAAGSALYFYWRDHGKGSLRG